MGSDLVHGHSLAVLCQSADPTSIKGCPGPRSIAQDPGALLTPSHLPLTYLDRRFFFFRLPFKIQMHIIYEVMLYAKNIQYIAICEMQTLIVRGEWKFVKTGLFNF